MTRDLETEFVLEDDIWEKGRSFILGKGVTFVLNAFLLRLSLLHLGTGLTEKL